MPKWSHYLDDEYLEEEPSRSFEKFKRQKKTDEEIRSAKKKVKMQPPPSIPSKP